MKTLKSLTFVLISPIALIVMFQANQIKLKSVNRSPAVETIEKKVKPSKFQENVKNFVLVTNNRLY